MEKKIDFEKFQEIACSYLCKENCLITAENKETCPIWAGLENVQFIKEVKNNGQIRL